MVGEMAVALILASRRIEPKKLLDNGYQFRFPALEDALRHELPKSG
jgi:NAD dependent epimerase/dehydratase family enzyme